MSESSRIVLKKLSSREVADQNKKYVDDRRNGRIKSLTTKYPKLNKALMGGIELDTITCVSALSGAGKSTLSKTIRDSIHFLNKDVAHKQYVFNFEMIAHQQIGRSMVTETKMPLRKLYSVDEPLSDEQFKELEKYYEELSKRDIDFIETPHNPKVIADSIVYYWEKECKAKGLTLVYEIDHALLCKGLEGQSEKERVDMLMYLLVDVKKYISSQGGHSVGIVLSQMNRDIRKIERITKKELHRPLTSDLFGASSIEQCSDYIVFVHMPAKLSISSYTTRGLPTFYKEREGGPALMLPYFELVKQRSGESDLTIPLWNKLNRFDFDEMDSSIFEQLRQDASSEEGGIPIVKKQTNILW